jgi:hypothetical protein
MNSYVKGVVLVCVSSMLLSACSEQDGAASAPKSVSVLEHSKAQPSKVGDSAVYFADGTGISFDGKILREAKLENARGVFQRYVLQVPADLTSLETSTFDVLARAGYVRKVRKEEPPLFAVSYLKKGSPTVIAAYKELKPVKAGEPRTQLVLAWRIEQ